MTVVDCGKHKSKPKSRSFTEEYESPIPVQKLWKAGVLDSHILMPKLLPKFVASVDIVEGDGGAGTIRKINFTEAVEDHKLSMDRLDVVDEAQHVFKYTVIDGGYLGSRLKTYSYKLKLEATGSGGSKVKLTVHYDTIDNSPLSEVEAEKLTFGLVGFLKAICEQILASTPE